MQGKPSPRVHKGWCVRPGLKVAFLPRPIKLSSLKNTKCQLNLTQMRRLNPLSH